MFPAASWKLNTTFPFSLTVIWYLLVSPSTNVISLALSPVNVTGSLKVIVTTTSPFVGVVGFAVMSPTTVGAVLSMFVTLNSALPVFPAASWKLTVIVSFSVNVILYVFSATPSPVNASTLSAVVQVNVNG